MKKLCTSVRGVYNVIRAQGAACSCDAAVQDKHRIFVGTLLTNVYSKCQHEYDRTILRRTLRE